MVDDRTRADTEDRRAADQDRSGNGVDRPATGVDYAADGGQQLDDRVDVARIAAEAGAAQAMEAFRGALDVETKSGPTDLVTETDREAQGRVRTVLERHYPDEPVVGEERGVPDAVPEEGVAWIVDPIDGTRNFVRGVRYWATAVVAVEDGEPIATALEAPALGDSYAADEEGATRNGEALATTDVAEPEAAVVCPTLHWPTERGALRANADLQAHFGQLRRFGSAQLELAAVADGGVDAAVSPIRGDPWDTLAGVHLVRAAGGRVTNPDGEPWHHAADGIVASNGSVHDVAQRATSEIAGSD